VSPQRIHELAESWASAQLSGPNEDHWHVIYTVQDLTTSDPEALWSFVLAVLRLAPHEQVLGMLAAGPLEDLIQDHGSAFINRVAAEAGSNKNFAALLPKVWVRASNDPVTQRFVQLGCDQVRVAG